MLTQKIRIPISFFEVGSVVDIEYPFEDSEKSKYRPTVIIEVSEDQITVVSLKISSVEKYENVEKYPYAVEIMDTASAGLTKRSWVLTNKVLSVGTNNKLVLRGHLSESDYKKVELYYSLAVMDDAVTKQTFD